MEEVIELILLFYYQTLNSPKLIVLYKTFKAARLTTANSIVLNRINTEIFVANTQKKQKAQYISI